MSFTKIRNVILGCVLTAALVSLGVVAYAERQRADDTQARYTETETELAETKLALTAAEASRAEVDEQLQVTSRSLSRTRTQAATLNQRSVSCRYVVAVNDRLLFGAGAYADATNYLLHKQNPQAKASLRTAARHARAVQTLVTKSGHPNISALVNACAPPQLTR